MKKKTFAIVHIILVLALAFTAMGCKKGGTDSGGSSDRSSSGTDGVTLEGTYYVEEGYAWYKFSGSDVKFGFGDADIEEYLRYEGTFTAEESTLFLKVKDYSGELPNEQEIELEFRYTLTGNTLTLTNDYGSWVYVKQ